MKKQFLIAALLTEALVSSRSAIYYQGTGVTGDTSVGTLNTTPIYDGNPASVNAYTMNLTSYATGNNWSLNSLTITLNISGGNNNGLYAYLVGPSGSSVTLMNQPGYAVDGFGATGAGMNITLSDTGSSSIQNVTSGSVLSGTYQAANSLSYFNGINPNGVWTLYIADTISGGGNATLNGWTLNVDAVPEPVNVTLGIVGGLFSLIALQKIIRQRRIGSMSSAVQLPTKD